MRPFHGHITGIECAGANGGLCRYRLVIKPWSAFLALRRDSTTYQDKTVFDIVDSVFKDYRGQDKSERTSALRHCEATRVRQLDA